MRRFRFFVAPTFRLLDLVCVQEPEDVNRWAAIGVSQDRIHVVGSIKYDPQDNQVDSTAPKKILLDLRIDNKRPILFGGSTHRGEEEILAEIFRELRGGFPDLFLIIAPRHAERAGEIRRELEHQGLRVALRTQSIALADESVDCLLLDSTGELRDWYTIATVVFIGKSLTARGGQNPAEAISAGRPIISGSHMENFSALTRLLVANGGAIQVGSSDELQNAIVDLLRDPALRERLAANARRVLDAHRGATARTAQLVMNL